MSGKAGTKNIQTQWAVPGRSVSFSFPLLFFRSWYVTIEQLTNWESQKKLRSKISKGYDRSPHLFHSHLLFAIALFRIQAMSRKILSLSVLTSAPQFTHSV